MSIGRLFVVAVSAAMAMSASVSGSARAQSIHVADSLLEIGALTRAESEYYAAVRVRPRDPTARWALGRFLVARGAPRVGATLFEEALQFGGEPSLIVADLAPVYLALGMYHELAALPSSSLNSAERERARWLDAHPTRLISPDSIVIVNYGSSPSGDIGRVTIQVNGRAVEATISPRVQGLVISDTSVVAGKLRRFDANDGRPASRGSSIPAVADSIGIGGVTYRNFPVAIQSLGNKSQAIVGFDLMARFAPTFDSRARRITLRVGGTLTAPPKNADTYATLLTPSDLRILQSRGWVSAGNTHMLPTLTDHRWTFDTRRGQLIVER
jgi:hypothetical protein